MPLILFSIYFCSLFDQQPHVTLKLVSTNNVPSGPVAFWVQNVPEDYIAKQRQDCRVLLGQDQHSAQIFPFVVPGIATIKSLANKPHGLRFYGINNQQAARMAFVVLPRKELPLRIEVPERYPAAIEFVEQPKKQHFLFPLKHDCVCVLDTQTKPTTTLRLPKAGQWRIRCFSLKDGVLQTSRMSFSPTPAKIEARDFWVDTSLTQFHQINLSQARIPSPKQ